MSTHGNYVYLCNCPDYTQEEPIDRTSSSPSRWFYRDYRHTNAGISTIINQAKSKGYGTGKEICYHCWNVLIDNEEFFEIPTT